MSKIERVNRRDFMKLMGLASTGILLGCNVSSDKKEFLEQASKLNLGTTLSEAKKPVPLNHNFCSKFCVLGGGACSVKE